MRPKSSKHPASSILGIDIGGSHIKALAFGWDGMQLAEEVVPTSDDSTQQWLKRAQDLVSGIGTRCPGPLRVGVAAPGLVSPDQRSIAFMPGRLSGLERLDWQQALRLETSVQVFNDAHAALLGEAWVGAAKGLRNVLMLTLGTGVGGAAMVDGNILRGHIGRAGHLGHVSLNPDGALDIVNTPGSLEDAIGECSLAHRSGGKFSNTRELVTHYRQGDREAAEVWLRSISALAAALAGFINVMDPGLIVIGGGIADADDALFGPLQSGLDKFEWRPGGARVKVVKAALGRNAGAVGAAYGAKLAAEARKS